MSQAGVLLDRAEIAHDAGDAPTAARLYQESLALEPRNPRGLCRFGQLLDQSGQQSAALPYLEAAAQLAPLEPAYRAALGDCRRRMGDPAGAESDFRHALLLNAAHVPALNNLALLLTDLGRPLEAIPLLETAAALRQDLPEISNNLGMALVASGQIEPAVEAYRAALAIRPDYPEALNNISLALQRSGDPAGAQAALERCLTLRPDFVGALNNLGALHQSMGRNAKAAELYQTAVDLAPTSASLWLNLGNALKQQGRTAETVAAYGRALALAPNVGVELKQALAMPPIQDSAATIGRDRAAFLDKLDELKRRAETQPDLLPDPLGQLGETAFFTAYHGLDDRALLTRFVDCLTALSPSLTERLVDRAAWRRLPLNRRLRVGFLSKFLRNHTIGKLYAGVIKTLPRDRFDVTLLRPIGPTDPLEQEIAASVDRVIDLPELLAAARLRVASENLDLLFYPELGMDAYTWFLAFARLAPVQAVGWGHPVTSAMPSMDYFVSGGGFEGPGAAEHYREKLVSVAGPGVRYPLPAIDRSLTRADLGLPEERRIYACPQSLFKFHPESDRAWARLLSQDPNGVLVIVEATEPLWNDQLRARFQISLGADLARRVLFLPRQPEARFAAIYATCDVALDPPFFGSGNTTLEAFAAGAPVITCPSPLMRTRLTSAFYRLMAIEEAPIAGDLEEYADLAVAIATDPARRARLSQRILAAMPRLFDRADVVQDYADFFEAAIRAAHANQPPIAWGDPT
jgi:predicted O-linked N-acetylglucosamine transferase (SPINDLY family)